LPEVVDIAETVCFATVTVSRQVDEIHRDCIKAAFAILALAPIDRDRTHALVDLKAARDLVLRRALIEAVRVA
jgi:hypothetical protein